MQAEILSIETISDLEFAFATFSSQAAEALAGLRAEFLGRKALLDGREEAAVGELRNSLEALENADAEEPEYQIELLSEARERLTRIRGWQARVGAEHERFLSQAASFDQFLEQKIPWCRNLLRTRCHELRAYRAVAPAQTPSGSAVGQNVPQAPSVTSRDASPDPVVRLTQHRLPNGFVWIPLADINFDELIDVTSVDSYKKVAYDTMALGLKRLKEEILPKVSANPMEADSGFFRSLDEEAEERFENGLQRIYEAFFSRDQVIYLERRREQDKFDVINGRHRIRVASDLGWSAIPARVKDLRA